MKDRNLSIDRLSAFTLLWGVATLIHQASFTGWISELWPLGWLLTGLAATAILWPRSIALLAALVGASALFTFQRLPYIPNHLLFEWFVNLTILTGIGLGAREARAHRLAEGEFRDRIFDSFAPAVRLELLLLYFFVTLHKLNRDFFDPEVSCGGALYDMMAENLPGLAQAAWIHVACIIATILFEGGIPLLLLFRRTRVVGILSGLFFHLILGFVPHGGVYSFSILMMTLLFLFTPREFVEGLGEVVRKTLSIVPEDRFGRLYRVLAIAGVGATLGLWAWGWQRAGYQSVVKVGFAHWLVWSAVLLITLFLTLKSVPGLWRRFRVQLLPSHALLWLFPVLICLNGMSPYLGSKTQTSFAMFSNLRTEDDRPNHLFLPSSLQLWDLQRDIVEIVATTDERLDGLRRDDLLLPYFQFRLELSSYDGDMDVTYRRNGTLERLTRFDGQVIGKPEPFESPSYLERKWLRFRPFNAGPKMECRH